MTHCMVRLRFRLHDDTAADDVAIARLPEVLMAVWQGGELHVALWIPVPMACRKVNAELGFQTG
ncbi:hypothetical protein ACFWQL_01070 [Amycolatopsis thermoflava]|uniref:hypothetical protein n=1 Tax=Amycolatopsis thermoflava TaxID=84480 RepID=UPI00365973C3